MKEILFKKVVSFVEYKEFVKQYSVLFSHYRNIEQNYIKNNGRDFVVPAICHPCGERKKLKVDYAHSSGHIPNWRERLICSCGLNSRLRASLHFLYDIVGYQGHGVLYLTEQVTPLYKNLLAKGANIIGSEYLGGDIALGANNKMGIRNEDATKLTFLDESFDYYLTFDVLEHIPNFLKVLKEAYRVLNKSGVLIFTVPFAVNSESNIVRAQVNSQGEVNHILEPEYHGDPIGKSEEVLCYYHFGWELLDQLKQVGFSDCGAYFYLSEKFGYLGGLSIVFMAKKK